MFDAIRFSLKSVKWLKNVRIFCENSVKFTLFWQDAAQLRWVSESWFEWNNAVINLVN